MCAPRQDFWAGDSHAFMALVWKSEVNAHGLYECVCPRAVRGGYFPTMWDLRVWPGGQVI